MVARASIPLFIAMILIAAQPLLAAPVACHQLFHGKMTSYGSDLRSAWFDKIFERANAEYLADFQEHGSKLENFAAEMYQSPQHPNLGIEALRAIQSLNPSWSSLIFDPGLVL